VGRLWHLEDVELMSSAYAVEEARRNLALDLPLALRCLEPLTAALTIVNPSRDLELPPNVRLDAKDQPILLAPVHGTAHYLLTGDGRHFEHLDGKRIERVTVLRVAPYLARGDRRRAHISATRVYGLPISAKDGES